MPGESHDQRGASDERSALEVYRAQFTEQPTAVQIDIEALCAAFPHLSEELRRIHRQYAGDSSGLAFEGPEPDDTPRSARELMDQVEARGRASERYRVRHSVGRGGMGEVFCAWDVDLRRQTAMKVMGASDAPDAVDAPAIDRFLEEAQITGQLDHPGVVPVHELGLDEGGRLFFTMRLVRGEHFADILAKVRSEADGWNQVRALTVILKVCQTMAFAHERGVVHRDLKPSNIMVGRHGEVYVMDWGIARVLGAGDTRDIRIRPAVPSTVTHVRGHRGERREYDIDAPLMTMDGAVIGTPSYMPPEQAGGDVELVGPRSDVYAMGAILYQLLTEQRPYVPRDQEGRVSSRTVLARVLDGPPTAIERVTPGVPVELVAICEKAMQREIGQRYRSMNEMADDLRAYLEHRVVRAHQTGAWAEFRKWVRRNRTTAAALALVVLVMATAGFAIAAIERRAAVETERHLDEQLAAALVTEAGDLWPVHPDVVPAMDRWLRRARTLVAKRPRFEDELAAIERRATGPAPERLPTGGGDLAREAADERGTAQIMQEAAAMMRRELEAGTLPASVLTQFESGHGILDSAAPKHERRASELEAEVDRSERRRWRPRFADERDDRRHEQLVATLANIERLADESFGLIPGVQQRRNAAAGLEQASLDDERDKWSSAIASIADRDECPLYDGLVIERQLGLVPLRRDDGSGLWEFWHVLSGERPVPGDDGSLVITPETGIVLVLVPGGEYRLGAQSTDPGEPAYDPDAQRAEGPPRLVSLAPYFIGKHEMTQGQWYRATGEQPSETYAGIMPKNNPMTSSTHPVEHVSWVDASRTLARWGLELPTEARWERAARGNTEGPYWTDEATIIRSVNFFDENARRFSTSEKRADLQRSRIDDQAGGHDDGYSHHAPVDSFPANPFGLHHVLGNVREWTKDAYCQTFRDVRESDFGGSQVLRVDPETGELFPANQNPFKTFRGGAFEDPLVAMRVTTRGRSTRHTREEDRGVRPARRLDRGMSAR